MSHLLEFYGEDCPHCVDMAKLVSKLEKEEGIKIQRFEVWNNAENEKKLLELDKDLCGGVPFFYNTQNNKFICGEADYKTLKAWAKGEDFTQ
jgi:thiol-disulfide isomerase/thioredoxin